MQRWIESVLCEAERDAASGEILSNVPMPAKYERAFRSLMLNGLAQGYWLQHVYLREVRAAAQGRTYRGTVSLSDDADNLKSALESLTLRRSNKWEKVIPKDAVDWIQDYTPKLTHILEQDVLEKVRDTIRQSMMEGTSLKKRVEALKEAGPELQNMAKSRLNTIARTELTRADTMGRLIGCKGNPDVLGVEFCATLDDRTTEICQARHGLVMKLDDPRLAYNTPPLHPNCRSMLLSATVYDHPDGLLTSREFDDVPDGIQRPEDVEEVQKILDAEKAESETIAVQDSEVEKQIHALVKEGVTTAKQAGELGNLVYNEAKSAIEAEGRAERLLAHLSRYRKFGGEVPAYANLPALKPSETAKTLVNDSLRFYPSDWTAAAFAGRDVSARLADFAADKGQSHLVVHSIHDTESRETRRIYELVVREYDEDSAKRVTAHLMERKIPAISRLEWEFYEVMVKEPQDNPLEAILRPLRQDNKESPEILSAGMMYVFNNFKDVWNKVPDFTKFILGLLLGV